MRTTDENGGTGCDDTASNNVSSSSLHVHGLGGSSSQFLLPATNGGDGSATTKTASSLSVSSLVAVVVQSVATSIADISYAFSGFFFFFDLISLLFPPNVSSTCSSSNDKSTNVIIIIRIERR